MSKKTNTVAALESEKTTTTRIKENYRFTGIGSRAAIINETDKCISAAVRSGIKSLLINMMSDSNVDLLTISFFYEDCHSSSILDSRYDKYSIVRNGEFVQIPIDNFLTDWLKVNSLTKIVLTIIHTDMETFETIAESKTSVFSPVEDSNFNEYEYKLITIYKAFVYELV